MSETIIKIQHLTKTFGADEGAVHALKDINLEIRQGEIFGIIGLSGDPNEAAKALSYIRSQPNVSAEEVEYHG